jgi:hypothetical protein
MLSGRKIRIPARIAMNKQQELRNTDADRCCIPHADLTNQLFGTSGHAEMEAD